MTLGYADYLSRTRMPALDGMRAISVLLVITVHVHIGNWNWAAGAKGVTIFFILSGYLITFLALREERETGALNLSAFYIRRTFRIFPIYYLMVALYAVLVYVLHIRPDKAANFTAVMPYLLTYLQEFAFFFGVNGATDNIPLYQSWSLGIEEKFYLVWPALAFVLLQRLKTYRLPVCGALAAFFASTPYFTTYSPVLFPYFHILVGCAIALFLNDAHRYRLAQILALPSWAIAISVAFVALHFISPLCTTWPFQGPIDVLYSLLGGVLLIVILLSSADKVLGGRVLVFIGRISYAIYLVQVLCLNVSEAIIGKFAAILHPTVVAPLNYVLACGLSILASWILAVTVERPLIKMGHRISDHLRHMRKISEAVVH